MVEGLFGRNEEGRQVLTGVAIAFVPAALVGVISEKLIKDFLFGVWPVVVAWIIGGVAVIALSRAGRLRPVGGRALTALTTRDAMIIGLAQVLALWPGTSRSLVTIVAALLVGVSMSAAVEFSFLLGFVTLTAATGYEALSSGKQMVDTLGVAAPLLGMLVAFAAAVVSIKWMVTYLSRHDLSIFGWYRIAVALVVIGLVATHTI
jgi:undecaprenyl-diphosphatase